MNVWCGILKNKLIGPFFIEGNINGDNYLQLLQESVLPALVREDNFQELYFMHDGAPAHFKNVVREWLCEKFTGRVIGRRGNVEWPPRSPDLNPLDFFLWGYLKEKVYSKNPSNLEELKAFIISEASHVSSEMINNAVLSVPFRLCDIIHKEGGYIE